MFGAVAHTAGLIFGQGYILQLSSVITSAQQLANNLNSMSTYSLVAELLTHYSELFLASVAEAVTKVRNEISSSTFELTSHILALYK